MVPQHPLIGDLTELSEEELQMKITELYKKLSAARQMGNAWLANQVSMALASYQAAYTNKLRKDPDTPFSSVIDIS